MGFNSELHVQMQDYLANIAEQANEGELSHLDALIEMRQNKEQLEKSLEIIKGYETEKINEIASKAEEYGGKYQGYEIKAVNGRKMYSFKGIEEVEQAKTQVSSLEEKYKSAFDGFQKGTVTAEYQDGHAVGWYDPEGVLQPFPQVSFGQSFLAVKKAK